SKPRRYVRVSLHRANRGRRRSCYSEKSRPLSPGKQDSSVRSERGFYPRWRRVRFAGILRGMDSVGRNYAKGDESDVACAKATGAHKSGFGVGNLRLELYSRNDLTPSDGNRHHKRSCGSRLADGFWLAAKQ